MQKIKSITIVALLFLSLSSLLYLNSCKKDACAKITCNNGGVCINGACSCTQGYEGTDCNTKIIDKYAGTYSGSEYYYLSGGQTISKTFSVEIISINQIKINELPSYSYSLSGSLNNSSNKSIYANVNLNDFTFQIPSQIVDGNMYMGDGALLADNKFSLRCSFQ
ncbi:MAG: hypothetical protein RIQ33_1929 [Bacteroidota bacterium]|jgi:hypothetical protein